MTRDQAKQFLPIIQAYAGGESIEVRSVLSGEWAEQEVLSFVGTPENYRIKPKEPMVFYINVSGVKKKFIEVMDESAE